MRNRNNPLLFKTEKPEKSLIYGYLSYVFIGLIFLSLPWFRMGSIAFIDNLFIAVSAISTTGLTTVSIADSYSFLGQLIILLLIQLGGIGYMTFGSFIILSSSQNLAEQREVIHKAVFSLPKDFSIKKFIRSIVIYTILIETIGALLLLPAFLGDTRANVLWSAIFHSISSFCTAGFSLYGNSFESYVNNGYLNCIVFSLSFLGAIGYIVMVDIWLLIRGKKKRITFTSRIILITTIILLAIGSFLLVMDSIINPGVHSGSMLISFFQAMTSLTTVGFNTVSIESLSSFSLFVLMILMIIGASPSGTGGGIKSTTVSSIIGIIKSVFSSKKEYIHYYKPPHTLASQQIRRGSSPLSKLKKGGLINSVNEQKDLNIVLGDIFKIKLMNKTIPFDRVIHAMATFCFYFIILFAGILFLLIFEPFHLEKIFFEAASALGTVGLSMGITPSLTFFGKSIIIILMFIGRLGPISFGVFLFSSKRSRVNQSECEDIVV